MKWLIFTMPLLLSACVVGRDYTSPEMPIPQKWSENVATQKRLKNGGNPLMTRH